MKKIINYFKSWGVDKWAHFGIGGLICALVTIIVVFSLVPIEASWILLLSPIPGIILVGMISVAKEFADSTGFSVLDIVAALIGCATVEITLVIAITVGLLSAYFQ